MSRSHAKGRNRVSFWNWMGTLALAAIPGVNIISFILFLFLAKTQTKRNFAGAGLLLMVLFALLVFVAFIVFPAQMLAFADWLKTTFPLTAPVVTG